MAPLPVVLCWEKAQSKKGLREQFEFRLIIQFSQCFADFMQKEERIGHQKNKNG